MVLQYIKFGVLTVLALAAHVSQADAQDTINGDIAPEAVEYNADGNPLPEKQRWVLNGTYDTEYYFKSIPDVSNSTEVDFWFDLIHNFMSGMFRGLYNDKSLVFNKNCFGDYYKKKTNEYFYLFYAQPFGDWFENLIPELALTYQFNYMVLNECEISSTVNDLAVYCWYKGCWPQELWSDKKWQDYVTKSLYIVKAINDAAIVWWEGVPATQEGEEDRKQWMKLSEQTGDTFAQIITDITNFVKIAENDRN